MFSNGNTCASQLSGTSSCKDYLSWKDCDKECNLCACSTATGTTKEHCSGHGTCEAECTTSSCSQAKCQCDTGWTGTKCEISGSLQIYNFVDIIERHFLFFTLRIYVSHLKF